MSISNFQDKIFKKGCGMAVMYVMAGVFAVSIFTGNCNQDSAKSDVAKSPTAMTVAEQPITASALEMAMQSSINRLNQQQNPMGDSPLDPAAEAYAMSQGLSQEIQRAYTVKLAQQAGAKFSDEEIKAAFTRTVDASRDQMKMQMLMSQQLKPNATDADFDAAFKAQSGMTFAEFKADRLKQIDEILKDPARRPLIVGDMAQPILVGLRETKLNPTDGEVRANFDSWTVKRILLKDMPEPTKKAEERASEVLAALKGGMTFEAAMDRFSNDLPEPKKKNSDRTIPLSPSIARSTEGYAPLLKMKAGEVSEPTRTPEGVVIYKLIEVKSNAPKDFEQKKANYRRDYIAAEASRMVSSEIAKATKDGKIKFEGKGYEALYDLSQLGQLAITDPAKREAALKAVITKAKEALEGKFGFDQRSATFAYYAAVDLLSMQPGIQAATLLDDRISATERVLEMTENMEVRLRLVDLLAEKKDGVRLYETLSTAAQYNTRYDTIGQASFSRIASLILKYKAAGLITAEQEKEIQNLQAEWRTNKQEADKQAEETRKQEAEAAKKLEAERKEEEARAKAEAAKEKANEPAKSAAPAKPSAADLLNPTGAGR